MTATKPTVWWMWMYDGSASGEGEVVEGMAVTMSEARAHLRQYIGMPLRHCVKEVSRDGNTVFYFHSEEEMRQADREDPDWKYVSCITRVEEDDE